MARSVLRQELDTGQWSCCPPECVSRVDTTNSKLHLTHRLKELPLPVILICADSDQPDARAFCKVGRSSHALDDCCDEANPHTCHLLLIENQPGAPVRCLRLPSGK